MKTKRWAIQRVIAGVLVSALLLAGCGGAEQEPPGVALERVFESYAVYVEDLTDAMASVQDRETANVLASRVRDEFEPRALEMMEAILALHDAYGEEQIRAAADALDVAAAEARIGDVFRRFEWQVNRLDAQPGLQTAELLAAMQAWGVRMDRLAEQMHQSLGPAPAAAGPAAPPGSREWCQQMLHKPEAQWTMQESLTFASRCIG